MNLDKNKPYGQIFGDDEGRAFEQNGKLFHSDGTPWVAPEIEATQDDDAPAVKKPAAKKAVAPKAAVQPVKAVPKTATEQQVDDQLSGQ